MWGENHWGVRYWGQRYWGHWGCGPAPGKTGDELRLARWQVRRAGETGWEDPVYDSGWGSHDLDEHTVPDGTLTIGLGYCNRHGRRWADCCLEWSEPFCWIVPGQAQICRVVPPLKRIEVWTDLECRGGVRVWILSKYGQRNTWHAAQMREEVNGREELAIELDRDAPAWDHIEERRVIRTVWIDDTWLEWRIIDDDDERDPQDATTALLSCQSPMYDVGERVLENRQADGLVLLGWELFGLTVADHVQQILQWAAEQGLDYFEVGQLDVDPEERFNLDYTNATALDLFRQLAELPDPPLELLVQPNETESYVVHLVEQIGAICDVPQLRYRKNNLHLKRKIKTSELATRVTAVGPSEDGLPPLTIAEAHWPITQVDAANRRLHLDAGPLLFDDQLNWFWAEKAGTQLRYLVTDSDATDQWIQLTSVAEFSVGDSVVFRASENGRDLTYLQNPVTAGWGPTPVRGTGVGEGRYGVVQPRQDPVDLPGADNLAPNGFLGIWEGDAETGLLPQDWFAVGDAVLLRNTDPTRVQHGSASLFVAADEGDGVVSGWVPITPTERRPHFTVQTALWVEEGQVEIELVVDTGTEEVTFPAAGSDEDNFSTITGAWITLSIGGFDLYEIGGKFARIRLTAVNGEAVWYLDAAQLTQTPAGVASFAEGLASNSLWHEANRLLALHSEPEISYDVRVVDLTRLDGSRWPFDTLALGADAVVVDADPFGIDDTLRIVALDRDLVDEGQTRVTLAKRPDSLTAFLARDRRGSRRAIARRGSGGGEPGDGGDPGPGEGSLTGLTVRLEEDVLSPSGSVDDKHVLVWSHNQVIEDAAAGVYTVDVRQAITDTEVPEFIGGFQVASGRDPKTDTAIQGTDVALQGSIAVTVESSDVDADPEATDTLWEYFVTLKKDGQSIQELGVSISGRYIVEA